MRVKSDAYRNFFIFTILSIAFGFLITKVDVQPVGAEDTNIGLATINTTVHDLLGVHMEVYKITDYIGYAILLVAASFALVGLVQLIRRKSLFKVDKGIWGLAFIYVVTMILYVGFDKIALNYRPIIMPGEVHAEPSFPSSHTMLACVVMGTAVIEWGRLIKSTFLKTFLQVVGMAALVVCVAGRLYCGVHWFTDIIGGILIALALIELYRAITAEANYESKH